MTPSGSPDHKDAESTSADRRVNIHLRVLFENACRITAPFYDPQEGWGAAPLTLYAQQALRVAYPELSLQEIALLFSGVHSFHTTRLNKHRDET